MAKGDGVKNETAVQRSHRMRGVVMASPDDVKHLILAPDPAKIHDLLSNRVGAPRAFNDPDELAADIEDYFMSIIAPVLNGEGEEIGTRWVGKPTVANLATHLGVHRDTLLEHEKNGLPEISVLIKRAKGIIAGYAESAMLNGGNPAAYINYLINMRMDTPWIGDEKLIKIEPVAPDNHAKSVEEIEAFLDDRALPDIIDAEP